MLSVRASDIDSEDWTELFTRARANPQREYGHLEDKNIRQLEFSRGHPPRQNLGGDLAELAINWDGQ